MKYGILKGAHELVENLTVHTVNRAGFLGVDGKGRTGVLSSQLGYKVISRTKDLHVGTVN